MSKKNKSTQKAKDSTAQTVLSSFLKKAKEGKYAEIEKSSLKYSRVKEQAETESDLEEYYYSLG